MWSNVGCGEPAFVCSDMVEDVTIVEERKKTNVLDKLKIDASLSLLFFFCSEGPEMLVIAQSGSYDAMRGIAGVLFDQMSNQISRKPMSGISPPDEEERFGLFLQSHVLLRLF